MIERKLYQSSFNGSTDIANEDSLVEKHICLLLVIFAGPVRHFRVYGYNIPIRISAEKYRKNMLEFDVDRYYAVKFMTSVILYMLYQFALNFLVVN